MQSSQWHGAMRSNDKFLKIIEQYPDETFTIADGFDDAIIGVDEENGKVVYDIDEIINILIQEDMTEEEAVEYYYYNIVGSYVGEKTPIFIRLLKNYETNW